MSGKSGELASLPAKHTTSYGSPAPVLPLGGLGGYGSDLRAATRDMVAAVQRDNKKAKLQHQPAKEGESGESAKAKNPAQEPESVEPARAKKPREDSAQRSTRAATPKPPAPEERPAEPERGQQAGENRAPESPDFTDAVLNYIPPGVPVIRTNEELLAAVMAVAAKEQVQREAKEPAQQEAREETPREAREQAQREVKERVEQGKRQREEREARERARREKIEREERERVQRKEQAAREREDRERARREEVERREAEAREREKRERPGREAEERAEREHAERARVERERAHEMKEAERKKRERAERKELEAREREDRERARMEERERQLEAETDRAALKEFEEAKRKKKERAAREKKEQDERERAEAAKSNQDKQAEEAASNEWIQADADVPEPANTEHRAPWQPPRKRAGQEFLDDLFSSPKRPRNNNQTPSAAHLMAGRRRNTSEPPDSVAFSVRSYLEESNVFREAAVHTPAVPSLVGYTPARPAIPGNVSSKVAHLPPAADNRGAPVDSGRPNLRPNESRDAWSVGTNPGTRLYQPGPRPAAAQPPAADQRTRKNPVSRPAYGEAGEEPEAGPSVEPRHSTRQPKQKLDIGQRRKQPTAKPPAEKERREDPSSSPESSSPSPSRPSPKPRPQKKSSPSRPSSRPRPHRNRDPPGDDPPPDDNSSLGDQIRKGWRDWNHYLWRILRWLAYFLVFIVGLNMVFHLWRAIGNSRWENTGASHGLEWYGWNHMGRNIGQLIPYDLRHPLGFLNDGEYNALRDHIYSQDGQLVKLADQSKDLRQTTQKLEAILPRVVSVKQDKKTSKLVIGQDFWHALKDLMHTEKSVLTLQPGKDGKSNISDEHWAAVLKRLKAEGVLSTKDVGPIVQGAVSNSWDNWLKKNRGKVDKALGGSSGQPLSADAEKKMLAEVDKLVREKISGKGLRDIVVTREDFISEVKKSINAHKREAEAELAQVQDNLRDMIEAAKKEAARSGGMTRQEVVTLTNEIVKKAISNARLEGVAKGSIHENFEVELSRRVNYFALGNGATIDRSLTSPSYNKPLHRKPAWGSADWVKAKVSAPRFVAEEVAALTTWEDAGQCWCAGNRFEDPETHPADINIRLAHSVVPETVVMEHIDPAATLDPKAMPKDIEVWAIVDEHTRRKHAWDFMFAQWPDTPKAHPLMLKGFLKIGQFTYEHNRATKGVHVYKISDELARLGITTDLVLIRATSNYGADHTCFYRVRLYGSEPDVAEGEGEV